MPAQSTNSTLRDREFNAAAEAVAKTRAGADDRTRIDVLEAEIKELERRPTPWALPRLLMKELPYLAMLGMALIGIAYTSFAGQSIILYWETLAPLYAVSCVFAGWRQVDDREARVRLIWTQALQWLAILATMNLIFEPGASGVATNQIEALNLMAILAGGTFIAGVHARAWQICVVGILLGLTVPAMIWVQKSALLLIVGLLATGVAGGILWLNFKNNRDAMPRS